MPVSFRSPRPLVWVGITVVLVVAVAWLLVGRASNSGPDAKSAPRPALTVSLTAPQTADWPRTLTANGNVAAWQEAVIGAEISNYRLNSVLVNVGDKVTKGQLLAQIASDNVAADLAQSTAAVAEAEANAAEAKFNAERARQLRAAGFYSPQQAQQSLTNEQTAEARLAAARARKQADELRMAQTQVRAPDGGIISARTATVGSLTQPGQELFRLIRGGRLEWRAEVTAAELATLGPGLAVALAAPSGAIVRGKVRMLGPTLDATTRNALVYVDLPATAADAGLRAGMFARGQIELGRAPSLTLPQAAVVSRDGFSYVFLLADGDRVAQTKVSVGRRVGDRVEITGGLASDARVVASGGGFLADGDTVRVVAANAQQ
ncbi:MAG TPA: efflux RND transporter periplasmic adaptor subunit [Rhodocyclaceae bacterium]|nr:efflux RND transporter periplasmic adaptor subunit [Rhodocyclaceae bacterium]